MKNDGVPDARKSDRYLTISILSDRSSFGDHSRIIFGILLAKFCTLC